MPATKMFAAIVAIMAAVWGLFDLGMYGPAWALPSAIFVSVLAACVASDLSARRRGK